MQSINRIQYSSKRTSAQQSSTNIETTLWPDWPSYPRGSGWARWCWGGRLGCRRECDTAPSVYRSYSSLGHYSGPANSPESHNTPSQSSQREEQPSNMSYNRVTNCSHRCNLSLPEGRCRCMGSNGQSRLCPDYVLASQSMSVSRKTCHI